VVVRPCSSLSGALAGALATILFSTPGSGASASPNQPIEIFVAGAPGTLTLLQGSIGVGEHPIRWIAVDRIDETQVLGRPREQGTASARAWVDCSRPDRVRIYFANWDTERFLVRDVPLPGGWSELARESIAQLIDSSIDALAADQRAGMSPNEMASVLAAAAPQRPPERTPTWKVAVGAFYAIQAFAPEQPIDQGPGLTAALETRKGRWRPGVWIAAQYQLPESIETTLVGVRLEGITSRAGARLVLDLTDRVALAVLLGAGGDLVHIAPLQGSTVHASLSPERFSWDFESELALSAIVQVGPLVELWAALFADAALDLHHYDVMVDGSTVRAMTPWWLRPGLMVGVSWP
jgi:hypothetical protein